METRAHLGVETQRQWSDHAIARTTPILMGLFSGIALTPHRLQQQRPMAQRTAAWYAKPAPTFVDAIALVRRHLWLASEGFSMSIAEPRLCAIRRRQQGCRASCGIFRAGLLSIQGWALTWKSSCCAQMCRLTRAMASAKVGLVLAYHAVDLGAIPPCCSIKTSAASVTTLNKPNSAGVVPRLYAKFKKGNGCPHSGATRRAAGAGRFFTVGSYPRRLRTPDRFYHPLSIVLVRSAKKCVKSRQDTSLVSSGNRSGSMEFECSDPCYCAACYGPDLTGLPHSSWW